jgi:Xaa-Pro dipeptidase
LKALRNLFASKKLDGYIAANDKNMKYFTGFSGGSLLLVPQEGESILFVYGVNYEAAKEETNGARVELIKMGENIAKRVANEIYGLKIRHIGFDSLRASSYLKMKGLLGETELEDAGEIVRSLRKVKDESELRLITKAAEITSRGMNTAFEIMAAGLKERAVAAEMEYEMRKSGSDGVAFETIVSSGPSSAFPHGGCGDREIRKSDFVVVDIGAKYQSYCADLTRTFIVGKPSPKQLEVYEAVKEAQSIAMNQVRAGIEAKEVDGVAREYIAKMGYGEYFVHSLGHGVGLDVHEPPTLGPSSKDVLASGNTVTVEPGIYIPKFGGVRIEDTVLVMEGEARKLTEAPVAFSQ